jgi:RNA exonuclease 1
MDNRSRYDDGDDRRKQPTDRGSHRSPRDNHRSKRRKHQDDRNVDLGMGSTLARLQLPDLPSFNLTSGNSVSSEIKEGRDGDDHGIDDWESVQRQKSKTKRVPKAHSSNYPSITFESESRLQSQIKISDLQALILYILADGSSPQWVAVRHRPEIRKVVVLMVPGLEMEMFRNDESHTKDDNVKIKEGGFSPSDDYYPVRLASKKLPTNVQQFADMFEDIWPVKTPGDDRYSKMHSPMHAMLTAPLSKNQEDKDKKGAKPAREPQGWQNKRTRITEFLSKPDELLENDYTLHPASYDTENERTTLQNQRIRDGKSTAHGWIDTSVDNFLDGSVPEGDIEQGSLTAGREILAMDCEMCMTGEKEFSLTRISVVGWDGSVVLDELVKPDKPIIDYVTM